MFSRKKGGDSPYANSATRQNPPMWNQPLFITVISEPIVPFQNLFFFIQDVQKGQIPSTNGLGVTEFQQLILAKLSLK